MFVEASTMLARLSFRRSQPEASKSPQIPASACRACQIPEEAGTTFISSTPGANFQLAVSSWAILPEMQANFRSQDSRGLCRFVFPEFPPASFRPLLGMTRWKLPLLTTLLTSNFHLLSFRPECFIISPFPGVQIPAGMPE